MKKCYFLFMSLIFLAVGCEDDDAEIISSDETGDRISYDLNATSNSGVDAKVDMIERTDGSTEVVVVILEQTDGTHPVSIVSNSVIEGGESQISLNPVDGSSRRSVTNITEVSYEELVDYDGHIDIQLSSDDSETIVSQGDIGINALSGESIEYALMSVDVDGISGTATLQERISGATLLTISLDGTPDGGSHPAHIHENTAAETGSIVIDLASVDGSTGMSQTHIESFNDGTNVTYNDLLDYSGYINVHLSTDNLSTLVAQSDIGANTLTGETKSYTLNSVSNPDIMGTATFSARNNGTTLVELDLEGTSDGGLHPAHIHMNSAAETGAIVIDLTSVDGASGMSVTQVDASNDGSDITYDELLEYDGYINVHESSDNLGTLLAQADIGANELTGNTKEYTLSPVSNPDISGVATLSERMDGTTLLTLSLVGTEDGNSHPAHIHMNTAAESGAIAIDLTFVDGDTGMSMTQIESFNDGAEVSYEDLLDYDGYINVHESSDNLGTLLAQGDIGQNELTGSNQAYILRSVSDPNINGVATFAQRVNDETLVTIELNGTPADGSHPAHIHAGSVAEAPGDIIVSFTYVNGETGISKTNVSSLDDGTDITYEDMLNIDGYLNVHLSEDELGILVAQGNVGANAN